RENEGGDAHQDRIEADRLSGDFRLADRAHRLTPGVSAQPSEKPERSDGKKQNKKRCRALAEFVSEDAWLRNVEEAVPAAGHFLPFGCDLLDHEAKGDRHHREVRTAHAQCREREGAARDAGGDDGDGKRRPEIPAMVDGENRNRVSADGIEAYMAERDLTAQAEQYVEADADDRGEADKGENVDLIAVGIGKRRNGERDEYGG